LVDAERRVEMADVRDRRLADADGADLGRFDQGDREPGAREFMRERRSGHPPRRAPADHEYAPYQHACDAPLRPEC
jgi:hypothetical protein